MGQLVVSAEGEDGELLRSAARWLARFYPQVDVIIDRKSIYLRCEEGGELNSVWMSALFNERSLIGSLDQRRRIIERLTS